MIWQSPSMLLLTLGEYCVLETSPLGNLTQSSQPELFSPSSECTSFPILILSTQRCEINSKETCISPTIPLMARPSSGSSLAPGPAQHPEHNTPQQRWMEITTTFSLYIFKTQTVQSFLRVRSTIDPCITIILMSFLFSRVIEHGFWGQAAWIWILALALFSSVILGKLFNPFVPQLSHL